MFRNQQINENSCSHCLHPVLVFKAYLGNDERKFFDRILIFCKLSLILKLIHSIEKSITLFQKRALHSVYLNETPLIIDFSRLDTITFYKIGYKKIHYPTLDTPCYLFKLVNLFFLYILVFCLYECA